IVGVLVRLAAITPVEVGLFAISTTVGMHRAELVELEDLLVAPDPALAQQDRRSEAARDQYRDEGDERREDHEKEHSEHAVEDRLHQSLVRGSLAGAEDRGRDGGSGRAPTG